MQTGVGKAMLKGAVAGGFAGMLFGLGLEVPTGWVGLLARAVIGAEAAAFKELTFEEAPMYLVEQNAKNSEYNADAQVQKQCSKLAGT